MTRIAKTALIGLLTMTTAVAALAAEDPTIRVGGNVQQANLLSQVKPVYPAQAKDERVQGTVQLQVVIDKQGHVQDISVMSGPEPLIPAAVDAVRQWTYRPTLLNGEPVKVLTTIDINFTLAQ